MLKQLVCGSLVALVFSTASFAESKVIKQAGKKFSEAKVEIKVGESLTFVNDDNVAHNVYAIIDGEKVDLGLQKPGEEGKMTFDKAGRFRARCAIHPKMKITVSVD